VPQWDSELVQAVKIEFPDDHDISTLILWQLAASLSGAEASADLVPLSKEFGRMLALLEARNGSSGRDPLDELAERRREKAARAGVDLGR
jgi:hypothetical protein